jgi:FMN phosphatase YigB (HAD superfamily)
MRQKVVALDIGGVCVQLRHGLCFSKFGYSSIDQIPEEFIAACDMLEKGELSDADWLNIFQEATGGKYSNDDLREIWNIIIGPDVEGMAEIAGALVAAGYKLVFFSDTSDIHALDVYRKLSFANLVTGAIFSFEVGTKKPGNAMYKAFEDKYGTPVFYVDDREENIEAARQRGWNAHCFTTADKFREFIEQDCGVSLQL